MLRPPRAASLVQSRAGAKVPTVYWNASMMVAFVSVMMVLFICSAIAILGYKVFGQDSDDDDGEIELEETLPRPAAGLLAAV